MAGQQPNKPRKTGLMIEREISKMFELMAQGYTDHEMQRSLGMSARTYYWYKSKMYKQYGELAHNKTLDVMYYQQQLLSDRLTRLYRLSDQKLNNDSGKMNGAEIAALSSMMQEIAINIFQIEREGLMSTNRRLNSTLAHNTPPSILTQEEVNRYLEDMEDKQRRKQQQHNNKDKDNNNNSNASS